MFYGTHTHAHTVYTCTHWYIHPLHMTYVRTYMWMWMHVQEGFYTVQANVHGPILGMILCKKGNCITCSCYGRMYLSILMPPHLAPNSNWVIPGKYDRNHNHTHKIIQFIPKPHVLVIKYVHTPRPPPPPPPLRAHTHAHNKRDIKKCDWHAHVHVYVGCTKLIMLYCACVYIYI